MNILDSVLPGALQLRSLEPDHVVLIASDGEEWTADEVRACVKRNASLLKGLFPAGSLLALDPRRDASYILMILSVLEARLVFVPIEMADCDHLKPNAHIRWIQESKSIEIDWIGPRTPIFGLKAGIAEEPAYVMPTSGTSGVRKWPIVSRTGLRTVFEGVFVRLQHVIGDGARWSNLHASTFGFSMCEILGSLAFGGTCVVCDDQSQAASADVVCLTASEVALWRASQRPWPSIVLLSGEAAHRGPLREAMEESVDSIWINTYAATETSGQITIDILQTDTIGSVFSGDVGTPIPGVSINIDQSTGAISIAGPTVGLGYLGGSNESWRFDKKDGERTFHTSDLGELIEGRLKVLGRADRRLKISGHWIDLDEIERELALQAPGQVAVEACRDSGRGPLAGTAFVRISTTGLRHSSQLRRAVIGIVGQGRVRIHLDIAENLQRSPSGKLRSIQCPHDRSRLDGRQPRTVWQVLLGDGLSDDDNLFEVGADSLSLAAAAVLLAGNNSRPLDASFFVTNPTIRSQQQAVASTGCSPPESQQVIGRSRRTREIRVRKRQVVVEDTDD